MARTLTTGVLAALLVFAGAAAALADPPPWAHHGHGPGVFSNEDDGPAQDRGVVRGTVAGVDYASGTLALDTPRGRMEIQVLPTTSIFRGRSGYASLTDLGRGTRVEVFVSQIAGRLVAQIIRIK